MSLKPRGHRILVQPDEQPEATDSGIVLPGDRDHVPTSGVVVAVGDGPARDAKIRAKVIARCMGIVEEISERSFAEQQLFVDAGDELRRYKNQAERFESLKVGDRVVYPAESGIAITEDGKSYILLNEDDVAVLVTDDEEQAA